MCCFIVLVIFAMKLHEVTYLQWSYMFMHLAVKSRDVRAWRKRKKKGFFLPLHSLLVSFRNLHNFHWILSAEDFRKKKGFFLPLHSLLVSFPNLHNFHWILCPEDFRNKNQLLVVYGMCCFIVLVIFAMKSHDGGKNMRSKFYSFT